MSADPKLPLRICFLVDNLTRAGVETQLVKLINQLDHTIVDPYLCLLHEHNDYAASLVPENCPVRWLNVRGKLTSPSTMRQTWDFSRFLRRERFDVLHVDLPASTLFGVPAGWLAGLPYLIRTRRDLGYWMNWKDRLAGRLFSHLVHLTITNCQASKRSIMEIERARPETIAMLLNDINLDKFRHIPTILADRPNGKRQVVGMVANLTPVKSPQVFVEAARRVAEKHPDVTFRIAGEGELRGALEKQILDAGLSGRFELPGHIADVPRFIGNLDIALLCSSSEGLPNVLLEYMGAGRPVIATSVGGNVEVIDEGINGNLVPPGDPGALSAAIDGLLSNPALAAVIATAGRSWVEREYGGANIAQRFEAILLERLGISAPARRQGLMQFGIVESERTAPQESNIEHVSQYVAQNDLLP